jgi:RimJ/RimL family protein N-acetyltransferase
LHAVVELAPQLGIENLSALAHPAHRASIHVLEKCGFTVEQTLRGCVTFPNLNPGQFTDCLRFSRTFAGAA